MIPLNQLSDFYAAQLREQIIPFWLNHAADREYGGYFTCLDREGRVYDPDKICMWCPGRIAWTFAYLYNEFEPNPAWLEFARLGVDFIRRHGFGPDGRMYYGLRRDGTPLTAPDGYHAELSSVLGMAEFARATRDESLYGEARRLFDRVWAIIQEPFSGWSPRLKESGAIRIHGYSMITINGFGIPTMVIAALAAALIAHIILTRTIFGRRTFAVGSNLEASRLAGVPVVIYTAHGFYFHDDMTPNKRRLFVGLERVKVRVQDDVCDDLEQALKVA